MTRATHADVCRELDTLEALLDAAADPEPILRRLSNVEGALWVAWVHAPEPFDRRDTEERITWMRARVWWRYVRDQDLRNTRQRSSDRDAA